MAAAAAVLTIPLLMPVSPQPALRLSTLRPVSVLHSEEKELLPMMIKKKSMKEEELLQEKKENNNNDDIILPLSSVASGSNTLTDVSSSKPEHHRTSDSTISSGNQITASSASSTSTCPTVDKHYGQVSGRLDTRPSSTAQRPGITPIAMPEKMMKDFSSSSSNKKKILGYGDHAEKAAKNTTTIPPFSPAPLRNPAQHSKSDGFAVTTATNFTSSLSRARSTLSGGVNGMSKHHRDHEGTFIAANNNRTSRSFSIASSTPSEYRSSGSKSSRSVSSIVRAVDFAYLPPGYSSSCSSSGRSSPGLSSVDSHHIRQASSRSRSSSASSSSSNSSSSSSSISCARHTTSSSRSRRSSIYSETSASVHHEQEHNNDEDDDDHNLAMTGYWPASLSLSGSSSTAHRSHTHLSNNSNGMNKLNRQTSGIRLDTNPSSLLSPSSFAPTSPSASASGVGGRGDGSHSGSGGAMFSPMSDLPSIPSPVGGYGNPFPLTGADGKILYHNDENHLDHQRYSKKIYDEDEDDCAIMSDDEDEQTCFQPGCNTNINPGTYYCEMHDDPFGDD